MTEPKTPKALDGPSPIRVTAPELAAILETSEIVRTEEVSLAGTIRVLEIDGDFWVQEQTPEGQILLRPRSGIDEAMAFVEGRLSTYDRMWDG